MSSVAADSEAGDATTTSSARRKSGRVTKKPEKFAPVASKRKRGDDHDSGDDAQDTSGDDEDAASTTTAPNETTTVSTPAVTAPPPGEAIDGATPCPSADGSAARTTAFAEAPPTCIDETKTYSATVTTSEGDITIDLDTENAPISVNNFVVLSRYHYFDGLPFHRLARRAMPLRWWRPILVVLTSAVFYLALLMAVMVALILLVSMEVIHEPPLIRLFSGLGFFWVAILVGMTLTDYLAR